MSDDAGRLEYEARFHGARFIPTEGMPAAALFELVLLERVTLRLAKLVKYSEGRMLSKSIERQFILRVEGFGPGSKTAELTRTVSAPQLTGFEVDDVFDLAGKALLEALDWAESDDQSDIAFTSISPEYRRVALLAVGMLGITLSDTESFEWAKKGGPSAKCTRRGRLRIIEASLPDRHVSDCVLIGEAVSEVFEPQIIKIKPNGKPVVAVAFAEPLSPNLLSRFRGGEKTVLVRGVGFYDSDGRLRELHESTEILPVSKRGGQPTKRTVARFEKNVAEVRGRQAGWLDGEGSPPDVDALDLLTKVLREAHEVAKLPLPIVSITDVGEVTVDWVRSPWRIGGEVERDSTVLSLFAVDASDSDSVATFRDLQLSSAAASGELAAFVDWVVTDIDE